MFYQISQSTVKKIILIKLLHPQHVTWINNDNLYKGEKPILLNLKLLTIFCIKILKYKNMKNLNEKFSNEKFKFKIILMIN